MGTIAKIALGDGVDPKEFTKIANQIAEYLHERHHVIVAHAPEDIPAESIRAAMQQLARAVRRGRPIVVTEIPPGMDPQVARTRIAAALPGGG